MNVIDNFTEYYKEGDYADSAEYLAKKTSYSQEFLNFLIILCEDFKYFDEVLMFITIIFGVITNIVVYSRPNFQAKQTWESIILICRHGILFTLYST